MPAQRGKGGGTKKINYISTKALEPRAVSEWVVRGTHSPMAQAGRFQTIRHCCDATANGRQLFLVRENEGREYTKNITLTPRSVSEDLSNSSPAIMSHISSFNYSSLAINIHSALLVGILRGKWSHKTFTLKPAG